MTLLICTYVPTGIVISADSRTTLTLSDGHQKTNTVLSDSSNKLFKVFDNYGVAHTGDAHINNLPIEHHIRNFEYNFKGTKPNCIETLTQELLNFFNQFNPRPDITLLTCGYKENTPFVFDVDILSQKISRYNSNQNGLLYGVCYLGDNDIVRRLLSNTAFNPQFQYFNNQDAIDFSRHLIRATIDQLKFESRFPTVGGNIDTILLTPTSCEFIAQKTLSIQE